MDSLTDIELDALSTSASEEEWSAACRKIKAARDGEYPHDWFIKVLASGVARAAELRWRVS